VVMTMSPIRSNRKTSIVLTDVGSKSRSRFNRRATNFRRRNDLIDIFSFKASLKYMRARLAAQMLWLCTVELEIFYGGSSTAVQNGHSIPKATALHEA
jgi:hypothetical protein